MERVRERAKEPEPTEGIYEHWLKFAKEKSRRKQEGKVVIKGKDIPWEQGRQGLVKHYLHPQNWDEVGVPYWLIGLSQVRRHSGKHKHRGGGHYLFVLDGEGYTINNGVKREWRKGDLQLMAINPEGNEHQHFNSRPDQPSEFLAFIYYPFLEVVGYELDQKEVSPDWKPESLAH